MHGGVLPVAVKILDGASGSRESFMQEVEMAKYLVCPNLVQFLCVPPLSFFAKP